MLLIRLLLKNLLNRLWVVGHEVEVISGDRDLLVKLQEQGVVIVIDYDAVCVRDLLK